MVTGLLDVEELDEGLLYPAVDKVLVSELLARFRPMYATVLGMRKLTLEVRCPEDLTARFDPEMIARVVENLLDNAVRYAPRGGRVEVRASGDADVVLFEVGNTDTCAGGGARAHFWSLLSPRGTARRRPEPTAGLACSFASWRWRLTVAPLRSPSSMTCRPVSDCACRVPDDPVAQRRRHVGAQPRSAKSR